MKPVLRLALSESGANIKSVADALDRGYNYVATCLNDERSQQLTVGDLVGFMRATNTVPLRWLAGQLGGVFVELPRLVTGAEDIYSTFLKAVSEVGEDSAAIERALSDREITDSEGQTLAAELDDTIAALVAVKLAVLAKAGKPAAARMTMPAATVEVRRRA
jgi:hypothetical protein